MNEKKLSTKAVIAQFMRTVREREHLTQVEFGRGSGVGQDAIARVEADKGPLPRLDAIAGILAGAGYELQLRAVKKSTTIETTM
jgi:transcriptional regulator with XRE-family HTH domain